MVRWICPGERSRLRTYNTQSGLIGVLYGGPRRDFSRQKTRPFSHFVAAMHHASPRHQLALPREHKHFARATETQLGEESDSRGGGWGIVGSMIVRPTGWPPIWQGKTPATQEGKQAETDHEQNLQVLRHAPRKALCARTIKFLL